MSDTAKGTQRAPKAVIEHVVEPVESETHASSAEAGSQASATIAVFVGVGVVIGQMRDGDNAAVNFIRRLFDK